MVALIPTALSAKTKTAITTTAIIPMDAKIPTAPIA
jgi:hypothetical protein